MKFRKIFNGACVMLMSWITASNANAANNVAHLTLTSAIPSTNSSVTILNALIQPGQPLVSWVSNNGANQKWVFNSNQDGSFSMSPEGFPGLCLEHSNFPTSFGSVPRLANCSGSIYQSYFAQKNGKKNALLFAADNRSIEQQYLIRSSAYTKNCLNIQGGSATNGATIIFYPCQYTGANNDRWLAMPNDKSNTSGSLSTGYKSIDTYNLSLWADQYALTQTISQGSVVTSVSPVSQISPSLSTTGAKIAMLTDSLGRRVPFITNGTSSNLTQAITTSVANSNSFTYGFTQSTGFELSLTGAPVPVTAKFTAAFSANQSWQQSQTTTNTVSQTITIPSNASFWVAYTGSSTISANSKFNISSDVGDSWITENVFASSNFVDANSGFVLCTTGSTTPACINTKPKGAI